MKHAKNRDLRQLAVFVSGERKIKLKCEDIPLHEHATVCQADRSIS
jgi:hypothetical protein